VIVGSGVRVGVGSGVRVDVAVTDEDDPSEPHPASPERQAPAAVRNARRSIATGERVGIISAVVALE